MVSLLKDHLMRELKNSNYKTYTDISENDKPTHENTESNILPTLPHEQYGEKVNLLLNSYQVKSKELLRLSELAESGYNTRMKKKQKEGQRRTGMAEGPNQLDSLRKITINPNIIVQVDKKVDDNDSEESESWKLQKYDNNIKVIADFGEYLTAMDSQNILNDNKKIIGNILRHSLDRQVYKAEEVIKNFRNVSRFNNKFLKVKISNIKPKIQDELKEANKPVNTEPGIGNDIILVN